MRSNASARQRRSMISDMDARIAIYDRSEGQQYFPSRKYAEDVFYSIDFQMSKTFENIPFTQLIN